MESLEQNNNNNNAAAVNINNKNDNDNESSNHGNEVEALVSTSTPALPATASSASASPAPKMMFARSFLLTLVGLVIGLLGILRSEKFPMINRISDKMTTAATTKTAAGTTTTKTATLSSFLSSSSSSKTTTTTTAAAPIPPFESLMLPNAIAPGASVQFLVDFVICGFPKTGTTSMMRWLPLASNNQIALPQSELDSLDYNQPYQPIFQLYQQYTKTANSLLHGYKNPNDIRFPSSLATLSTYFPRTKLIVGLRHPVWWFQSWYNFKLRQGIFDLKNKPPQKFASTTGDGENLPEQVFFHIQLYKLGKTKRNYNATTTTTSQQQQLQKEELEFLFSQSGPQAAKLLQAFENDPNRQYIADPLPNPLFLYEFEQYTTDYKRNVTRFAQFRHELGEYLTSTTTTTTSNDLTTAATATSTSTTPNLKLQGDPVEPMVDPSKANNNKYHPIDICHYQYRALRDALVQRVGQVAAQWLEKYLLPHPDVHVANPDHFAALLQTWKRDPCQEAFSYGDVYRQRYRRRRHTIRR